MYETSKAVVIEKPFEVSFKDIRLPPVDDTSVVIRTVCSGITSGTGCKIWNGKTGKLGGKLWYPLIPGYEQVGIVEYVGENAMKTATGQALAVGDRVMANEVRDYPDHCAAWGGQVGISVKRGETCSPFDMPAKIPDNVDFEDAVVAYLAAVSKKGFDKVAIKEGETVVVVGMGAVGLSFLQFVRMVPGVRAIAVDISKWRADRAAAFADDVVVGDAAGRCVVEQVSALTGGRMVDVVVEASGDSSVVNNLCLLIRDGGWEYDDDGGRIHLQGDYPDPISITQYSAWFNRNLRISTSCAIRPGGKEEVLQMMSDGLFDASVLWDKKVPAECAGLEYSEMEEQRETRMKTLLTW